MLYNLMFTPDIENKIKKLYENIEKDDEFEIMFNNYKSDNKLALSSFVQVAKYFKWRSDKDNLNLSELVILDIFYSSIRISIKTNDNINKFLSGVYQLNSKEIIKILLEQYYKKDNFEFITKLKNKDNIIDVDDFDIRFRKTKEKDLNEQNIKDTLKELENDANPNIKFRYKQRMSLQLGEDFVGDLTIIKTSDNISNLTNVNKTYELELDYSPTNLKSKMSLEKILLETNLIKTVLSETHILISKEEELKVLKDYQNIIYDGNTNVKYLYTMQPVSAEVQHFLDYIPNKYSVTDKADGNKYQLLITENNCYLISSNLKITKLSLSVENVNDSLFEGEYIYIAEQNKWIFMIFDCLVYKEENIRNNSNLSQRLSYIYKLCNIINKKESYKVADFSGAFSNDNVRKHYQREIEKYFEELNNEIKNSKKILLYPKLFLIPNGSNNSEVFLFSELIWINCTKNSSVNCPYVLDGIIYTGLNQKYTNNKREQKLAIYKYKPPSTNSLDVYVTFEKNVEKGTYMDIFDNSLPDKISYKEFRVCNFFVGSREGDKEIPSPFLPAENNNEAFLPLINGHVRDIEGNIIQDKTVIEIIYNNNPNLPHQYRWSVLRTRWDKTESVNKYNKRYGNFTDVATRVWKSIIEAVTIEEIVNLAKPDNYATQMKILESRLSSSIISSEKQQDVYYQKITNLIKKMRDYHNWIKSVLIYTYCSPAKRNKDGKIVRQSVLDIGCGRGGDILKWYHARVGEYVGFDIDFEGIYSSTDGAINRYNHLKKKFPNFGKVTYLQADGSIKLNAEDQSKGLSNISTENKKSIEKIFTSDRKFDIISSQFAIHYLFSDETSINNFIHNIKSFLRKNGYILLTLFDADLVNNLFQDSDKYTSNYTDEDGQRQKLYEIVKKYDKFNKNVGNPINVLMSWINDDYIQEYLVSKELLVNTMKKAGCRLVDTDTFKNVYEINKPYFTEVIKYEENPKNKIFYERVAEYYTNLSGADKESKNYSFLNRYYIFQKTE